MTDDCFRVRNMIRDGTTDAELVDIAKRAVREQLGYTASLTPHRIERGRIVCFPELTSDMFPNWANQ